MRERELLTTHSEFFLYLGIHFDPFWRCGRREARAKTLLLPSAFSRKHPNILRGNRFIDQDPENLPTDAGVLLHASVRGR